MTFEQKLAVLIGAGIALAATVELLTRWAASTVARMVDDGLAALAESDADWADDTETAIDEAVALTVPLYGSETASRIAAIIAHNEAARADWDAPARWTR